MVLLLFLAEAIRAGEERRVGGIHPVESLRDVVLVEVVEFMSLV